MERLMRWMFPLRLLLAGLILAITLPVCAQTTPPAWLRYAIPPDPPRYHDMPHAVVLLGSGAGQAAPEEETAADELDRGLGHMVAGTDLLLRRFDPRIDAIVLGTTQELHRARLGRSLPGWVEKQLPEEGFRIVHLRRGIRHWYVLQGGSPRAEMWAAFRFAALVAEDRQLPDDLVEGPQLALRAVALEGDPADLLRADGPRAHPDLLRLFASVGLNALITDADQAAAAQLAAEVRPYGLRLWVRTAASDALQAAGALAAQGNIAGLVIDVPADADAQSMTADLRQANAAARQLQRFGRGVLLRGVLEPVLQSNGNKSPLTLAQRLALLHGGLEQNVTIVGDAVSPLLPLAGLASANFGLLPGSAQAASFDLFPVRSRDVAYPLPSWERSLRTPERGAHGESTLLEVLRSSAERGGAIGRVSVPRIAEMMQQPLLQANLYAFGRLLWNPAMDPAGVTEEWSRQTWGDDARIHAIATQILMASGEAFTGNSSPFGLPSLADSSGGPDPARAALEHGVQGRPLADREGFGTDRASGGTGEAAAYPGVFAETLEDAAKCPAEWLLAFHHAPYTHIIAGGKTAAQAFYDAHFAGAAQAANALDAWESTRALVDATRYAAVHEALEEAARQGEIWRETTTEWLERVSGVRDALGFVGNHPGRTEGAAMDLSGYRSQPAGAEDGVSAVVCGGASCSASMAFRGAPNVYRIEMGYLRDGTASFELRVNGIVRARWSAQAGPVTSTLRPSQEERFVVNGIALQTGDKVEVRAEPHDGGHAPLQFVEITRDPRWN